jgi:hypothetical protein
MCASLFVQRAWLWIKHVAYLPGWCKDVWVRVEFAAGRGMSHIHGLLWASPENCLHAEEVLSACEAVKLGMQLAAAPNLPE